MERNWDEAEPTADDICPGAGGWRGSRRKAGRNFWGRRFPPPDFSAHLSLTSKLLLPNPL